MARELLGHSAGFSQRRVCRLLEVHRSSCRYEHKTPSNALLRAELRRLAEIYPRYGYRRLHIMLDKEQFPVNRKATYRAYRQEDLKLSRRKTRKKKRIRRKTADIPTMANEQWAMDFVSDVTEGGTRFRVFAVIDVCTKQCLTATVSTSMPSRRVCQALEEAMEEYGRPERITQDNGPEFASKKTMQWHEEQQIDQDFIEPGKPYQNGFCESFNARFRAECLDIHCFRNVDHARKLIEEWRLEYNSKRPHSSLNYLAPDAYRKQLEQPEMMM